MFENVSGDGPASALAGLEQLIDELHSFDWTSLPGEQLLTVLRELETQKRRLAPVDHALIAEIDAQGLAHEHACRRTANLLTQLLRVSPAEAAARVHAAADLGPRRGLTGEVLPPLFPHVAAAQATGTISAAPARVVTATIDALPAAVQAEHEASVQTLLVEQAHDLDPTVLKQVARRITDTLNPGNAATAPPTSKAS